MVHMHFNNLKVYLQTKGLLKGFKFDRADKNMCQVFGGAVQETVGGLETEESWVVLSKSFYETYIFSNCVNFWAVIILQT